MKRILTIVTLVGLVWTGRLEPAHAQYIWVNVSYKAILDPATGQPAPYVSTNLVHEAIRFGNLMLEKYQRGFRLRLAEPLLWIGGSPHAHDPSRWYPFRYNGPCASTPSALEEEFRSDAYTNYPALYGWNHAALNVFLTTFPCNYGGGFCATCTGRWSDYIANGTGQGAIPDFTAEENFGAHMVHETGHYFQLDHTFGGTLCVTNASGTCLTPSPGDDGITDTLRDVSNSDQCACWSIENLSWTNYHRAYAALAPQYKWHVDNVWYNVMSYHERFGYARMTEGQLDRWTDAANSTRRHVVSGFTYYTSPDGLDDNSGLASTLPKRHVSASLASANPLGGDIVLLRPGNYDERLTLNRPVTLRATRAGWATVGRP